MLQRLQCLRCHTMIYNTAKAKGFNHGSARPLPSNMAMTYRKLIQMPASGRTAAHPIVDQTLALPSLPLSTMDAGIPTLFTFIPNRQTYEGSLFI